MTPTQAQLCEIGKYLRLRFKGKWADLIESQAARIAELEADCDCWRDQCAQRVADWDEMRKERDALRLCVKDALEQCVFDMATDEDPLADRMRAALQAEKDAK